MINNKKVKNKNATQHAVIKHLGFSGLRAFVLASTFSTVDTNALRKPNRFIPQNRYPTFEKCELKLNI